MIRFPLISLVALVPALAAADAPTLKSDLLRFTNGDQLHGTFQGFKEGPLVVWQRDDVDKPTPYKTEKLRQVVLRGGRPAESLTSLGHVALVNGDRIPGEVTAFDEAMVTVRTSFAGDLRIPREKVWMLAPNPLGGRVRYHGPFVEDEWWMTSANFPDGFKGAEAKTDEAADAGGEKEETAVETTEDVAIEEPKEWDFSGAAWYWSHREAGTALSRREGMPDRAILRCELAWRNRLSLGVAFHADFARPPQKEEDEGKERRFGPGESAAYPRLFGNSYVLHIYSNYVILYRCGFNEDDQPYIERIQATSTNVRLAESGSATMELRCNRLTGEISLFINDEFAIQWSESGEGLGGDVKTYAGKGGGFGFMVQTENSPVRVSDIVVAEWNGMPDSARSLQVDDQDIVLLANGTDRFSGKVTGFADGRYILQGKYGEFLFPAEEIAEMRFARNNLVKADWTMPDEHVQIRFHPLGRISGLPLRGSGATVTIDSTFAGELQVDLESAVMLDFNPSTSFLDDWDSQF